MAGPSRIEDAYPLSPLQEGLLFHCLESEVGKSLYVSHVACRLSGLDRDAFERAFQALVDHHPVLRTAFVWEGVERPLQVVGRRVRLPLAVEDWRGLPEAEREARLDAYLEDERRRGFDPAKAPLMRLALFRTGEDDYAFVYSHHHLILDGWSIALLLGELFRLYEAYAAGREASLGPVRRFRDYIAWLGRRDPAAAEGFWRRQLAGFSETTVLGADRGPGAAPSGRTARATLRLGAEETARLARWAARGRVTPATVAQGVWALLLRRASGAPDVVHGTVVSGRPVDLPGAEATLGLFINTLPVRVRLEGDPPVLAWLGRLQRQLVEIADHAHAPLERVQAVGDVPSGRPLFETLLLFENYPTGGALEGRKGSLRIGGLRSHIDTHYPITVTVTPGERLAVTVTHDPGRIDATTARRLLAGFGAALEALPRGASLRVSEVPLLTAAERHQVLVEGNDTAAPGGDPVPARVVARAAAAPDAVAVVAGASHLSYGALERRSGRWARRLRALGVGRERAVAVAADARPERLVALLAVLRAGGAYLPLDPEHPRERLAFMLRDAGAALVLGERRVLSALAGLEGVRGLDLDRDLDRDGAAVRAALPQVAPDRLAYVVYTSGSTGRPKGVMVSHGGLANLVAWHLAAFAVGPADRASQTASPSFDAAVWESWPALAAGATLVLVDRDTVAAPPELAARLAAERVTVAFLATPLAEAVLAGEPAPRGALRLLLTGGDRLHRRPAWPLPFTLVNDYGPTEGSVVATSGRVRPAAEEDGGADTAAPPIGRPIANVCAHVVGPDARIAPLAAPGELWIGGPGLARGYRGRPGASAASFVPDPWGEVPGARLYRTGDRVRLSPGGELDFLGRLDRQVQLRGFRVELGEIEAVLAEQPEVAAAAVGVDRERLVAWVVPAAKGAPGAARAAEVDGRALAERLSGRLPSYMVPAVWVPLEALPLLPSGKVDRRALPAPPAAAGVAAPEGSAEADPVRDTVAAVWSEVLGTGPLAGGETFVELGGHSLLAVQVVSRLREALGVALSVRELFEAPTLAGLARRLAARRRRSLGLETLPLAPVPGRAGTELSFPQRRLWFLEQLQPGRPTYNIPTAATVRGALSVRRLEQALSEVVRRHEALRTRFERSGGEPRQVVAAAPRIELAVADLSGLPEAERERRVEALTRAEAARPFDLSRAPLLRARLMRSEPGRGRLLLTLHHIAADGWSIGVLMREVAALYGAWADGRPSPLPELVLQYGDYAHWQHEWLASGRLEPHLGYWRRQLDGAPPRLTLPTDRPRRPVRRGVGGQRLCVLEAELTAALRSLARGRSATLFMLLLAAFQSLLGRWARQEDVVVGTPVANRNHSVVEGLVGFFLNSLALRTDLAGEPSFEGLLERVRATALAGFAHQEVPFELLLDELQPERSLAHTPVFQVFFNLLDFEPDPDPAGLRLDEPDLEILAPRSHAASFDLTLYARSAGEWIELSLVYDSELFEGTTAERMLGHLHRLLEAAVAAPRARASTLPLLSAAERIELLAARNRVVAEQPFEPFPRGDVEGTIPERFARAVALGPDRVAVRTPLAAVTYGELARRAGAVAAALLARGGETGDRAALLFDPGAPMLAAVLGSLAAGRVYVPLDPSHPPRRLAFVLRDSGAAALLSAPGHAARARELAGGSTEGAVPVLDVEALEVPADAPAAVRLDPGAPAYILYTSGSTGEPKGVVQSHRNALHHAAAYTNALHVAAGDRLSLLASFAFDAAVMDVFGALLNGAELVPADLRRDGFEATARWLRTAGVTLYHSTPTVFRHLAPALGTRREGGGLLSARAVVLGGEEVVARDLATFRQVFPEECLLVNGLGPTESTTALQLFVGSRGGDGPEDGAGRPGAPEPSGSVPVGFPVEETEVLLLDEAGEDAGILALGEIAIASQWVALGYWRRPELTAAAFSGAGHGRVYRTGDLGRRLPDGAIEFAGRKDAQVKIRGHRVETGEVEAVLAAYPTVREAVVLARPQPAGGLGLAAWVVPAAGCEVDRRELRRRVAERLPDYMVPFALTLLPELPLTATGKVDRKALPDPEPGAAAEAPGGGELRGPIEEALGEIWCELLGLASVDREASFFELGGHSLAGVRMVARLHEALGVALPLAQLFSNPTIAGLAGAVAQLRGGLGAGDLAAEPIPRRPAGAEAPLSFAQQRLWFLDQLEGPSAVYNMPLALELSGPLGVAACEQAVGEVERRQEALRTRLPEADGVPVQRVEPYRPRRLALADLSGLPGAAAAAEAERLRSAEARRPFGLAAGPLFRARLLRFDGARHHLLATLHHTVGDGWSLDLLVSETAELYAALGTGRPSPLPDFPVRYADFAAWQRRVLDGASLERLAGFWRDELAGAPPLADLPLDRPRPELRSVRGGQRFVRLPAELGTTLAALGRRRGATLFMTLAAALQALLFRLTGDGDLCLGTPVAGRDRRELERVVGLFVNTLVLRGRPRRETPFVELLAATRETALTAFAHQDLPFERLVDELGARRDLSHPPVFQVMLVLQNQPRSELAAGDLALSALPVENRTAKLDLTFTVVESPGGLDVRLEHASDLFDATTAGRFLAQWGTLLAGVAESPERRLGDLPLLGPGERHQLVVEGSETRPAPVEGTLPELFARAAGERPEAIALVCCGVHVSYGELLARAAALARRLRERGVGAETRVGLHLDPGPEMLVAILGTLGAGGAYLPLDPAYPAERLRVLLDDGEPALVLTTGRGAAGLPPHGAPTLALDEVWAELAAEAATAWPPAGAGADSLAYVIYTSGSTGRPKGVAVSHRNVIRLLATTREGYGLGPDDRWSLFHSSSFDFSVWEIWGALLHGGLLIVVPYWVRRSPDAFFELLDRERVSVLSQTPTAFRLLQGAFERAPKRQASSLRLVVFGGEALAPADLEPWLLRPAARGCRMVNMYGITETTVHTTWRDVGLEEARARAMGSPVGEGLPDTVVRLLDPAGRAIPLGVAAEIQVGGPSLARGYAGRPGVTAARFVPDPYAGHPGERLYRSGDLARRRPDGSGLEFLSRADRQVKIRGHRIERGEVEAALAAVPGVERAAVVAVPGAEGDRLAAYVVPGGEAAPTTAELRSALGRRLPAFMVPSVFVFLDALPTTPSGKVDTAALPSPEPARSRAEDGFEEPLGEVEETLAGVWREVLRVERVGRASDFFELGGDSILSIQVVARARARGWAVTPKQVFQFPVLEQLAALALPTGPGGVVEPSPGPVPLTPIQAWLLEQPIEHLEHWNQALLFEVGEPLAPDRLAACLADLARRHAALRLAFERGEEGWRQELRAAEAVAAPRLVTVDLSALPAAAWAAAVEAAAGDLQGSFDLAAPPLLAVGVFDLGPGEPRRLLLVAHHLVVDGVSWRILLDELQALYDARHRGEEPALPPASTPFPRWAERLREHAASPGVLGELEYWLGELATPVPPLPLDFGGGERDTEASLDRVTVALDPEETRCLVEEVPRVLLAGVEEVLLAALAEAVGRWIGERRLRVDVEGHGREDVFEDFDLSRTVGWFTSLYPVVLDLEGCPGPGEAVVRVREALRRVPGKGIGFGLLRHLGPAADRLPAGAGSPIRFNYLGRLDWALAEGSTFTLARESPGPIRHPAGRRTHPLAVDARILGGRLQATWSFSRALHRRETVERVAEEFAEALRRIAGHARVGEEVSFTPGDFPGARLDQEELDLLLGQLGGDG